MTCPLPKFVVRPALAWPRFTIGEKVRWFDAVGDEAAAAARGREQPAKEDRRGLVLGQSHASGRAFKKALTPDRRRKLVDEVREVWRVSVRKVCRALRIERSLYTYKSKRGDQAALKQRIKEICETRIRFGYRRVHVLLRREGWNVNPKWVRRLYNVLGLQLRHKPPKRRVKARQTDRQRLYRSFQQQLSAGVPECPLVYEPR